MGQVEVGVTGLGAYTPLGIDVATTWTAALESRSGISDASFMPPGVPFISPWSHVKYFGRVANINPEVILADYGRPKEFRDLGRASLMAIKVGLEALDNAGILRNGKVLDEHSYSTAIMLGTGGGDSSNVLDAEAQRTDPLLYRVKPNTTKN